MKTERAVSAFKQGKKFSASNKLKDMILSIDNFGCPVQLLVRRNEQHQTFFGGCFTFAIVFLTTFYFYQLLNDMIYRLNPQALTSILFFEEPSEYELDMDEFFFAFAVQNPETFVEYQNRSLFNVEFSQCTKENVIDPKTKKLIANYTCDSLPVVPCNFEDHVRIPEIKPFFKKLPMNTFYCIDHKKWSASPPTIKGTFDNSIYKWISIQLSGCQNQTGVFDKCASQEEIDAKMSAGYFEVFLTDVITDQSVPDRPYSKFARTIYSTFSKTYSKEYVLYMRHLNTDSDDGYIMTSPTQYHSLTVSSNTEMVDVRQSNTFLNLVIRLETKRECNHCIRILDTFRQYNKIQDIFGIIGGFWQSVAIIGIFLVVPINKLDLQIKMINEIFNFEVSADSTDGKSIKSEMRFDSVKTDTQGVIFKEKPSMDSGSPSQKLTSKVYNHLQDYISNKDQYQTMTSRINQQRKINQLFKEYFKLKIGKIKLTTSEYIWYFVTCVKRVREKQHQIKFAAKKMEKEIDLIQIVKKITELEKLKMLLLTNDQLHLFDYLPRPCIPSAENEHALEQKYEEMLNDTQDKRMQFWSTMHQEKTIYQRAYEALIAYEHIKGNEQLSEIDQKLIRFLDPSIKRLFDMGKRDNKEQSQRFPLQLAQSMNQVPWKIELSSYQDMHDVDEQSDRHLGSSKILEGINGSIFQNSVERT